MYYTHNNSASDILFISLFSVKISNQAHRHAEQRRWTLPALQEEPWPAALQKRTGLSCWRASSAILKQHWRGQRDTHQPCAASATSIFRGCSTVSFLLKPKTITYLWEFPCQSYKLHPISGYQLTLHNCHEPSQDTKVNTIFRKQHEL